MVESGGLENRCAARYRGFESYSLRFDLLVGIFLTLHTIDYGMFTPWEYSYPEEEATSSRIRLFSF